LTYLICISNSEASTMARGELTACSPHTFEEHNYHTMKFLVFRKNKQTIAIQYQFPHSSIICAYTVNDKGSGMGSASPDCKLITAGSFSS